MVMEMVAAEGPQLFLYDRYWEEAQYSRPLQYQHLFVLLVLLLLLLLLLLLPAWSAQPLVVAVRLERWRLLQPTRSSVAEL
jgi:uncharacterized BrkB/YihY/UPF0761 family membrane protein